MVGGGGGGEKHTWSASRGRGGGGGNLSDSGQPDRSCAVCEKRSYCIRHLASGSSDRLRGRVVGRVGDGG